MKIRNRFLVSILALVPILLPAGLGLSPASASSVSTPSERSYATDRAAGFGGDRSLLPDPSPLAVQDLVRSQGLSSIDAESMLRGQDTAATVDSTLQTKFPGEYVEGRWLPGLEGSYQVTFSGTVPDEVLQILKASNLAVTVNLANAPTKSVSERWVSEVAAIAEASPGVDDVTVWWNGDTGVIGLNYSGSASTIAVKSSLAKAFSSKTSAPAVSVQKLPAEQIGALTFRGGVPFGGCTGGFVVGIGSGATGSGITTAAHCDPVTSYDAATFTSGGALSTSQGDIRWMRYVSGPGPTPKFQIDYHLFRDATGSGNPLIGGNVCRFGLSSGNYCGTVYMTGISSYGYSGLYALTTRGAIEGDSGGPYWTSSTARGILHGWTTINGQQRELFTPIQTIMSLGLYVFRP